MGKNKAEEDHRNKCNLKQFCESIGLSGKEHEPNKRHFYFNQFNLRSDEAKVFSNNYMGAEIIVGKIKNCDELTVTYIVGEIGPPLVNMSQPQLREAKRFEEFLQEKNIDYEVNPTKEDVIKGLQKILFS